MNNQEELNEFLEQLLSGALKTFEKTNESQYLNEKKEQFNIRLEEQGESSRKFLEEYAFELGLDDERRTEFIYRQGIKDCIWLLKRLGVLA